MKKIMTTILALGLATVLVGCSKSETKKLLMLLGRQLLMLRNTKRLKALDGYYQMVQS